VFSWNAGSSQRVYQETKTVSAFLMGEIVFEFPSIRRNDESPQFQAWKCPPLDSLPHVRRSSVSAIVNVALIPTLPLQLPIS